MSSYEITNSFVTSIIRMKLVSYPNTSGLGL